MKYFLIRAITFPFAYLPYPAIHAVGRGLGTVCYGLFPAFRKRTLSNLSLSNLNLSEKELKKTAVRSFQNLLITCCEYPKLDKETDIHRIVTCDNPEEANEILKKGKGLIFFCGHQANWELLFLEGTSRMQGVAIGRPIKNTALYDWVLSIRQKFGGTILTPQNAIKEGLRALKKGIFLGIVGDQGMPNSGYCCPFLGRMAWTSPMPALLSYRTGAPIITATTQRVDGKYRIHYSAPIYPNQEAPQAEEIDRMMRQALAYLEEDIVNHPDQWLWQHNRWKQQTPDRLKRAFRQESIYIVLPDDPELFAHLHTLRTIYPHEFITLMVPEQCKSAVHLEGAEILTYRTLPETLLRDYRFKLVFDFAGYKQLHRHFLNLSAFNVFTLEDLKKLAPEAKNTSDLFTTALMRTHAQ